MGCRGVKKSLDIIKINTGDKYFIVDNFRIREVVGGTFTKCKWDDFRFKDKVNADNWVINNKPCLCLIDVAKNVNVYGSDFEDLKKLIKTRL